RVRHTRVDRVVELGRIACKAVDAREVHEASAIAGRHAPRVFENQPLLLHPTSGPPILSVALQRGSSHHYGVNALIPQETERPGEAAKGVWTLIHGSLPHRTGRLQFGIARPPFAPLFPVKITPGPAFEAVGVEEEIRRILAGKPAEGASNADDRVARL